MQYPFSLFSEREGSAGESPIWTEGECTMDMTGGGRPGTGMTPSEIES